MTGENNHRWVILWLANAAERRNAQTLQFHIDENIDLPNDTDVLFENLSVV
jgi:hypothetical protein